ncbi:MAG: choice-of-anchor J domain-containing protein, partial [Bacteroidota bacterium]
NQNIFGVYDGVLQPGETVQFELGMLQSLPYGDYSFSLHTELAGDTYPLNNDLNGITLSYPQPQQLPLPFMNFIGFFSNNLGDVYPGWYEARGKGTPLVEKDTDWQGDEINDIRTASVFYTGLGTEDWMVSPPFGATENLVVEFKAAAEFLEGGEQMGADDKLALMVSADCGASWQEAAAITASSGISTALQQFSFPIDAYEGEDIIFAFYATTGNVSDSQQYILHITDISIKNIFDLDAGITRLLAPGNSCAFGTEEEVVVEIKNFGSQTISNFQVAYSLNGADPVVETITQDIPYNEVLGYTFNTTVDLTQQDENTLSVYTMLENDEFTGNDSLANIPLSLSGFDLATQGVYLMSFEEDEDSSDWLVEDTNNDDITWTRVDNAQHARTGNFSFEYLSNQSSVPSNDWLFTPCFYLQEGKTYYVSFYYKNRASNWPESLKLMMGQEQNAAAMDITLLDLGAISNSTYQKGEATFTATQSGEYYLGWNAYGPADQFGMNIDDISIYQVFDNDLAVVSFKAERQTDENCVLNNVEELMVEVWNPGGQDFSSVDLALQIEGQTPLAFSFTEGLAAGETAWFTLAGGFSLDPQQPYDLEFSITNTTDENAANDTLSVTGFLHANYFMGFETDEDFASWTIHSLEGVNEWHLNTTTDLSHSGQNSLTIRTDGGGGNTANDDWAITPCFDLKAGTCYEISFYYRSRFSTENLAVYMGNSNEPADMTQLLIDLPSFNNDNYQFTSQQFTVEEDGVYYFGWHTDGSTSGRYYIYVDDIRIVEDAGSQPVADPVAQILDSEVHFMANAENYSSIEWDFGDGNTSDEVNPFHVYEQPGTYNVVLTLGSGCVDATFELDVTIDCVMEPDFTFTIDATTVSFTATGDAVGYEWDFGDGNVGSGASVSHTYQNTVPTSFNVMLTAYYDCGHETVQKDVFIEDVWEEPTQYALTLVASPAEGGLVTGGGDFYPDETTVVTAVPYDGYEFVQWQDEDGNVVSTQMAFVFTMPEQDVTLTAVFVVAVPELYQLTLTTNLEDVAELTGAGEYEAGEQVSVTVTITETGYVFEGWYEDSELLSIENTFTFPMPERDVELMAEIGVQPFVSEHNGMNINLFPNPAKDRVFVSAGEPLTRIAMTDMQGRVVYRANLTGETEFSLSLDGFRSGIYFVQLISARGSTVKKLQVK